MRNFPYIILLLLAFQSLAVGQNPTAFNCTGSDGFGYYTSSASYSQNSTEIKYSSSRISKITTSNGNRVTLCTADQIGVALNGLAFNPHDNFLYAVSRYDEFQFSGKLYRLGENCQKLEIPVTGPIVKFGNNNINAIDAAGGNISSATFDLDNNYYVNTSFTNAASTGFTNKLQKIEIINNTATVKSTVTMTCPSCTGTNNLRVTDIIFDEESSLLYGSNKITNKLYSINPSTGILTEVGPTGITSSILGIYKNKDGNVRAISESGNIYGVNIMTGTFTLISTISTLNSGNADAASGCYAPPRLQGTLFIDANGLTDGIVNGVGTNIAGATLMYANLIKNGLIIKSTIISSNGEYQFLGLFSGMYEVQIAATKGVIGQAPPSQNLPNTYQWVGDNTGVTIGNDGTPNGKQNVNITSGIDVINVNFGIDGIPITNGLNAASQVNPGGTIQVPVPTLTFSDPEEPGIKNLTIELIPNPSTLGTLYYDGVAVTLGQNIPNFNNALLKVDPVDGNVTVAFTYFITDMAGLVSNVSTVTMPFNSSLPVELVAFSGLFQDGVNVIQWSTASESNSDYFEIERRSPNGEFESIGNLKAKGNSSSLAEYRFIDEEVLEMAYYRLLQVDLDGHFEVSKTILLKNEKQRDFKVYPTITSESIFISIDLEDQRTEKYIIFNMEGKVVNSGLITSERENIDVRSLPNGTYFIRIDRNANYSNSLRFVKME